LPACLSFETRSRRARQNEETSMQAKAYTGYLGGFDFEHKNPPLSFNPDFDPKAEGRYAAVTASMEADDFYTGHTREECAAEWKRRYDDLKAKDATHG
jgi:hypothetical protein